VSRKPLEPVELSLSVVVAAAFLALGIGLGSLGPLAVLGGALVVLGTGGWLGGRDSRDGRDRWPFGPR
jgi:hypothetical protein